MGMAATSGAIALTLIAAGVLYTESAATRRLEQEVLGAERLRERLESDIAVLKAERAFLAQPAKIERAARAFGMRPALERHYVTIEDLVAPAEASAAGEDGNARGGPPSSDSGR